MESRIHNKRKMKQLIDFKGCAVDGGMYPTDIDGVIGEVWRVRDSNRSEIGTSKNGRRLH